jgi:hypothetical protein
MRDNRIQSTEGALAMDAQEGVSGGDERHQPSVPADLSHRTMWEVPAAPPSGTHPFDTTSLAILKHAQEQQRQTLQAQRIYDEAEARWRRAFEAWQQVVQFKGAEVPRELHGQALWRQYAERIVRLGQVLNEDGWQARLEAVRPGSEAKTYALGILRRAMVGDLEGVLLMLTGAGDALFQLGLEADYWLREGLMHEVFGIEPAPQPPCGWEGFYSAPLETVEDFARWIDLKFLEQDFLGREGNQSSDGSLVRDAFRLVTKLRLEGMPLEPYGPFTLQGELAALRNLRRLCEARLQKPVVQRTEPAAENLSPAAAPSPGPTPVPPALVQQVLPTPETKVAEYVTGHPNAQIADVKSATMLSERIIRRTQAWKKHEDQRLDAYLQDHRDAGTPQVKEALGFCPSKTVMMMAWERHQQRRAVAQSSGEVKTRSLDRSTLECRPDEGVPGPEERISQRDELMRKILEHAPANVRGRLNGLTAQVREAFLDSVVESLDGQVDAGEEEARKVEILLAVTESWLEEHEQEQRHAHLVGRRSAG